MRSELQIKRLSQNKTCHLSFRNASILQTVASRMPTQQNIGPLFGKFELNSGRAHKTGSEVMTVWVLACSSNLSTKSSGTRWLLASGNLLQCSHYFIQSS